MKILIVASHNKGRYAPFIVEQVDSLLSAGVQCEFFGIHGKGFWGYLRNYLLFLKEVRRCNPDVIHAHYGLSGVFANLQRRIPVITTYHGTDINNNKVVRLSRLAIMLSHHNIFVSQKNIDKVRVKNKYSLIPCGVDLSIFHSIPKNDACSYFGWDSTVKRVLFAGSFNNDIKNPSLAKASVALLPNVELIEMKGYSRNEISKLMNACDTLLMTSHSEGSPQVIKEALACGCPIVSVDVGDVAELTQGLKNCFIVGYASKEIADALSLAIDSERNLDGRQRLIDRGLDNTQIASALIKIYQSII